MYIPNIFGVEGINIRSKSAREKMESTYVVIFIFHNNNVYICAKNVPYFTYSKTNNVLYYSKFIIKSMSLQYFPHSLILLEILTRFSITHKYTTEFKYIFFIRFVTLYQNYMNITCDNNFYFIIFKIKTLYYCWLCFNKYTFLFS